MGYRREQTADVVASYIDRWTARYYHHPGCIDELIDLQEGWHKVDRGDQVRLTLYAEVGKPPPTEDPEPLKAAAADAQRIGASEAAVHGTLEPLVVVLREIRHIKAVDHLGRQMGHWLEAENPPRPKGPRLTTARHAEGRCCRCGDEIGIGSRMRVSGADRWHEECVEVA